MNIGTITVAIAADTKRLQAGLNAARTGLQKFTRSITAMSAGVAALASAGIARLVTTTAAAGDSIDDMANKLSISASQLQALNYVAEQTGSSAATMDRSLAFLQKTIGKAAVEGSTAEKTFAALGLEADALTKMGLPDAFMTTVAAIGQLTTESERAAAATLVFGRAGQELNGVIKLGAEGVAAMSSALAKNGGIVSDADIAKLGSMNDGIAAMVTSQNAAKMSFVAAFGPGITSMMEKVSGFFNVIQKAALGLEFGLIKLMGVFMDVEVELADIEKRRAVLAGDTAPLHVPPATAARQPQLTDLLGGGANAGALAAIGGDIGASMARVFGHAVKAGEIKKGMGDLLGMLPGRAQAAVTGAKLPPAIESVFSAIGGLIGGAAGLPAAAGVAAGGAIAAQMPGERHNTLAAMEAGSRESYAAAMENMRPRTLPNDPNKATAKNTEESVKVETDMLRYLRQIADNVGGAMVAGITG